jgi:hypothetical protein
VWRLGLLVKEIKMTSVLEDPAVETPSFIPYLESIGLWEESDKDALNLQINRDLLMRIADVIVRRPCDFDMDAFEQPVILSGVIDKESSCGTVCCIGGWAGVLYYGKENPSEVDTYPTVRYRDLLGLNSDMSKRLFNVDHWPKGFRLGYHLAETDLGRATVAHDRIHHFVATDGAD